MDEAPWWADLPIDWTREEPAKVRDVLMSAYEERASIRAVVKSAGLRWPHAPGGTASAADVWTWAIEEAARAGLLFELYGAVLADPNTADFRRPLVERFGGGLATGVGRTRGDAGAGGESVEAATRRMEAAFDTAASDLQGGLQTVNLPGLGFADSKMALRVLRDALARTAMVEMGGRPRGTGFLVGPDLLLTAAHVIDAERYPPRPHAPVTAVFDYLPQAGVSPAETGTRVPVVDLPLSGSLPTTAERQNRASDWDADADHLDYLLMRLARPVADEAVEGAPRGFYALGREQYVFDRNARLSITQHPLGQTQVTAPVLGPFEINASRTRLRYRGNTLPGSSGAAVLDLRGRLVALHHFAAPRQNQGVPAEAIARHIQRSGFDLPEPATQVVAAAAPQQDTANAGLAPPADPDPFETPTFGRRPFANREGLRTVIRTMLADDSRRILVIEGGEDAGKSYSWRFLDHLEARRHHPHVARYAPAGFRTVKIDLDEYVSVSREDLRERIITRLCTVMELVPPETGLAQAAREVSSFTDLLEAKLSGTNVVWWLFFDSLDRHVLEHGQVDELIAALCRLVDEKSALPLRLVLASRPPLALPGDLEDWAERDEATGLSRAHVKAWLEARAAADGPAVDADRLSRELDVLFPPGQPPPSAAQLARRLPTIRRELYGGAGD